MQIVPFTRRCICPTPPVDVKDHTPACNDNYRVEFVAAKDEIRAKFYAPVVKL
jgi:hypothetical protein